MPDAAGNSARELRPSAAPHAQAPLKVGVLVDLTLSPEAGGHVKCWERLAEAATRQAGLDLTVHFNGPAPRRIELSPTVRYQLLPPVLSTARLVCRVPDHTDLSPWHPQLARALTGYDVIHTTDAFFCYSKTATRVARRHRIPLVSSIHTNTPEYARLTADHLLETLLGRGAAYRFAAGTLRMPDWAGGVLRRRLRRHLRNASVAIGNYGDAPLPANASPARVMSLRRGLDPALFTPAKRDRRWLERRFGVPAGHALVLYAGKLNPGKNVGLLGRAIAILRERDVPVHLICAGAGEQKRALEAALGPALTCPGPLSQEELARAYASADIFAFPSTIDEYANAVMEALASGLPVVLAEGSPVSMRLADCPAITRLPGCAPEQWAAEIARLIASPAERGRLGRAARIYGETHFPTWEKVLVEDLLPVWQEAAASQRRAP